MVKEVNPMIHVNQRDYPVTDHHCDDPKKKKLLLKLSRMITDNIPRKLPGGMKENHMDFWTSKSAAPAAPPPGWPRPTKCPRPRPRR